MGVDAARHIDTEHFRAVLRVGEYLRRDLAGVDNLLLVVDVVQEHVQGACALDGTGRQAFPLFSGQQAWNHVKRNQPFSAGGFAIYVEGDADSAEQQFGFLALALQLLNGHVS